MGRNRWPAARSSHGFRQASYETWRPNPLGVNAEFVFDAAETFCERAGHSGGNTARISVNPRMQPNAGNQNESDRATVGDDVDRDLRARQVMRAASGG